MTLNAKDFGAVGDGKTLNTKALQNAIDALGKGGTLVISDGDYVTGTLELHDHVTLRIEQGARLVGSRDVNDYRDCGFYHNEMKVTTSLLYALGRDGIVLEGDGEIDLNGDAFMDFDTICPCGIEQEKLTPTPYIEQTVVSVVKRPTQPIFFDSCKNITVRNLTVRNSPCWTLVFSRSENIKITGVTILNPPRVPNNDGVHVSASKNIVIGDCVFLCGDDCFAATCITDENGVCEDIAISNCVFSSRSAAIRFGHLNGHVRRATVNNVVIKSSNRGICVFAKDGGEVSDLSFSHIVADTKIYAGGWWGKGEGCVICAENSTGKIENVLVSDSIFTTENPITVAGKGVTGVRFSHCTVRVREGDTHEFFRHKMDLQPNIPDCVPAPYPAGSDYYVQGAEVEIV